VGYQNIEITYDHSGALLLGGSLILYNLYFLVFEKKSKSRNTWFQVLKIYKIKMKYPIVLTKIFK
jgi:hypothetical protein